MEPGAESWVGAAAFLLGLAGGTHCALMCGGIAATLSRAEAARSRPFTSALLSSSGRIASYGIAGGLVGSVGLAAATLVGAASGSALRLALGGLMIVTGIVMVGGSALTARVEALGRPLWRRISPLIGRLGPPDRLWKLVALGAVWGWLPCGLVYAALAAALATGSFLGGAVFMICFGLGTLPWLVGAGVLAGRLHRWLAAVELRRGLALLIICYGLWTIVGALGMGHGAEAGAAPSGHVHHPTP
jgi:sulfite exporter TauE/SafE